MRSLPRWSDISIPGNLSATRERTSSFSKQNLSGFSHLPRDIPAMRSSTSLHLRLPGARIARAVGHSTETAQLQESCPIANDPFPRLSCQKCPLLLSGTKPNPTGFSGPSQQWKLFTVRGMAGGGSGGARRNNAHTSHHILHDFRMLCAKLFILCSSLSQHQKEKKQQQHVAVSPPFPPGPGRGGNTSVHHLTVYRGEVFPLVES